MFCACHSRWARWLLFAVSPSVGGVLGAESLSCRVADVSLLSESSSALPSRRQIPALTREDQEQSSLTSSNPSVYSKEADVK